MTCPQCPHLPHPNQWCPSCNCYAHTAFDPPHAHRDDIETSHYAAATNTTSETHQRMILRDHRAAELDEPRYRGFTDEESGQRTGLETVEARRRCNNLRNLGYLMFTDETRPGIRYPTKPNQVSIITDTGRKALGSSTWPTAPPPAPKVQLASEPQGLW